MSTTKLFFAAVLVMTASCTLAIGALTDCSTDADCASKGAGLVCVERICVTSSATTQDAGCERAECYACTPASYVQYLNACTATSGQCVAFDNIRVTLRLADGGLPPLLAAVSDAGHADSGTPDAGPGFDGGETPRDAGSGLSDAGLPWCDVAGKATVLLVGSTAAKPFLAALGRVLFNDAQPLNLVYQSRGSCIGVDEILNGKTVSGAALYWDPASSTAGNEVACRIEVPRIADIAISDVFAQTCFALPNGLPPTIGEFLGPVQTMTFVVPTASSERSISAEAAYAVFGFGVDSALTPWRDPAFIFRRNSGSGTQAMIAAAIGVPSSAFRGLDTGSSGAMSTRVIASSAPQSTLGILAYTDISDAQALSIRVLAYQHFGQSCGYLPDSSARSKDKKNVRDGHYALWGPLHLLSPIDPATGFTRNAGARRLLSYIAGTTEPPGGLDLVQVEAVNNLVPACAMRVARTAEIGAYTPASAATAPCGCRFEVTATGSTDCKSCTTPSECPASAANCSYGYCER